MFCQHCGTELQLEKFFCVQCGKQFRTRYPLKKLVLAAVLACLSGSLALFLYLGTRQPAAMIPSTNASPALSPTASPNNLPLREMKATKQLSVDTPPLPKGKTVSLDNAKSESQSSPSSTRFLPAPSPSPSPTPLPFSPLRKAEPLLIAGTPFTLHARRHASYIVKVGLNQRHARLVGEIKVRGGDQDVWVGVLTEQEFGNFAEGQSYGLVYGTNLVSSQILNVPLSPGNYRVVISNQHAQFLSKHVYPRLLMWFVWAE